MINKIRTIHPQGLNKEFGLKFCKGSRVRHETPEESQRTHWPKHCECNNEDEINSPSTLSDKNYQASSQKFRQMIFVEVKYYQLLQN